MWQYRLQVAVNRIDDAVPRGVKDVVKKLAGGSVRWIYHTLTRVTPGQFVKVIIQDGPLSGRPYVCTLKYERDLFLGKHEPEVVDAFRRRVHQGDTVIDVGGHSGYFALVLAQFVGLHGKVISFEPSPENVARFRQNMAFNADLAERISLRVEAVTDRSGDVGFVAGEMSFTGHVAIEDTASASTVHAAAIDDVVASEGLAPALIKMDIEGGEFLALAGLVETLRRHKPHLIVEIHDLASHRVFLDVLASTHYVGRAIGTKEWSATPIWIERVQFEAHAS